MVKNSVSGRISVIKKKKTAWWGCLGFQIYTICICRKRLWVRNRYFSM